MTGSASFALPCERCFSPFSDTFAAGSTEQQRVTASPALALHAESDTVGHASALQRGRESKHSGPDGEVAFQLHQLCDLGQATHSLCLDPPFCNEEENNKSLAGCCEVGAADVGNGMSLAYEQHFDSVLGKQTLSGLAGVKVEQVEGVGQRSRSS